MLQRLGFVHSVQKPKNGGTYPPNGGGSLLIMAIIGYYLIRMAIDRDKSFIDGNARLDSDRCASYLWFW